MDGVRKSDRRGWVGGLVWVMVLELCMVSVKGQNLEDVVVGDWELSYTAGQRQVISTLSIRRGEDGRWQGRWRTGIGEGAVEELKVEEGRISFIRRMGRAGREFVWRFEGEVEGDELRGQLISERGVWPVVGRRVNLAERAWEIGAAEPIRLNTLGYRPGDRKRATIGRACREFVVERIKDGQVVLQGQVQGPVESADTYEQVFLADFSELREPGEYRLVVEGVGRSAVFRIGEDVYNEAFRVVMLGMYLWRCGTAVRAEYGGNVFEHGACHLGDAWGDYAGLGHVRVDVTGGWHDAGDYNKYVCNAGVSLGAMLAAWEMFADKLEGIRLGLPESGGRLPDYLCEVKWELDWLLKMQREDGGVYHKVSTLRFGGFIPPERETSERYLAGVSTTATANVAAVTAKAARAFQKYEPEYARRLREAAERAWGYLEEHPAYEDADQSAFHTGTYSSRDEDERLWAAAELWETTGKEVYLKEFETRARALERRIEERFDWGNVGNLGMFTYLLSRRPGRDPQLVKEVGEELIQTAEQLARTAEGHPYGRTVGGDYWWGVNGMIGRQAMILMTAYRLRADERYVQAVLEGLGHLFGRNLYGRSFVTGLGHRPPMHPHDRRSGGDGVEAPWPGYLVGGANPTALDWKDEQGDFRTNEIAINWNTALIFALAGFVEPER